MWTCVINLLHISIILRNWWWDKVALFKIQGFIWREVFQEV